MFRYARGRDATGQNAPRKPVASHSHSIGKQCIRTKPARLAWDRDRAAGGHRDHRSIPVSRECFRPRHRISHPILDGCLPAMARGHHFSTLGGLGKFRIWRAALYFLSADFLDAGRGARPGDGMENGPGRADLADAGDGRGRNVSPGARMAAAAGFARRRGSLHGESVSIRGGVLPE